jgi:hypothetical protein
MENMSTKDFTVQMTQLWLTDHHST